MSAVLHLVRAASTWSATCDWNAAKIAGRSQCAQCWVTQDSHHSNATSWHGRWHSAAWRGWPPPHYKWFDWMSPGDTQANRHSICRPSRLLYVIQRADLCGGLPAACARHSLELWLHTSEYRAYIARVVPITNDILSLSVTLRAVFCLRIANLSFVFSSWISWSVAFLRFKLLSKSICSGTGLSMD